ncbi:MAG: M60 family peptidase N-terminal accessory domain-containing protein [Cyclobacteriaceae bacterium]
MKNLYLLLIQIMLFCLPAPDLAAQVASYHFDGTPTDELGGTDPTYIIREVNSDASGITYTSGVDDQAVYLDSASGFVLPMEVTDALMSSNVWSFQMRFKVTDHGDGDGQRMLINLKRGGTGSAPYFRVFSTKDSDTQGRVVFQMNNGEESASQFAFYFDLDEWVNLSLLVDFTEGFYTLTGDNYFVSSNFTDFDYERFKTYGDPNNLENIRFRIGYYQELGRRQAHPAYKTAYTSDLVIDELTISNTHPETDVSVYENALQQLTNHLNGSTSLSAEEISTYAAQALTNFKDNYPASKAIVDAYFDAYENVHEPMFMGESGVSIYEDYDEFGWVLFNLQLDVFDNYVSSDNIDDVDGLVFETSVAFPGPVAETAERVTDQNFTINGTYIADLGYNKKILEKGYGDIARRGTGYYAAPGERITVTVPNELVGIGGQVVIGTFTHDVSNKVSLRRLPRAIKEFEIVQANTDVISPLGGIIYIYIPEGADLGNLDLSISGAVKFAYYEQSSTNIGDITDFQTRLESAEVLWAEVVTDNFMYTGPLAYFKFDDTMQTLETWDTMWEAYQLYNGRPFPLHKAEHLVHDKMTKWNTLAGGYPMNLAVGSVPYVDDFWGSTAKGHMMNILEFDKAIHDNKATYWHEMSHHTGLPTLPWEVECIVELAFMVTNHLGNNMPLDSAFKYASRGFRTRDDAIVDWVVMEEFRTNEEMTKTQRQYQQRGYSKYVDVGVLFGWEALGSINKVFYDYWTSIGGQTNDPELNIITDTEWILASCEALNVNVAPLYHFWGEQPNDTIMAVVNSYPRSEEIYLRLREIRDFIPTSAEEFQPYFDAHAPSNTNSQNYQPYQDALAGWNTNLLYDSIIAQVDSILYLYYDGDFDQDGYVFTADLDDLDPLVNTIEGTYIIGSSDAADYPSFTEAITNLRTIEITGDVTYSVESGTYNETVNLSSIDNGEHTITFRGTDKATTIIHPLDSIPSDKSGISIFGTNNIVLKNFTLEMDNISSTKVIADSNESKGINISNASNINLGDLVLKNDGESFDLESRTHFIATSISLVDVSDVTISGCFFSMAGVHTWIDDFINVNISNNSFQQGQYHVRNKQSENVDGSGLLIDNNTMTGPMEGGIDIMGFDDHQLIEGVIVRNNILNGIEHADRVYYNAPQERYNGIDLYNTIEAMVHHNTVDTRFGMGTYNNESLTVHSNIFLSSEDAFGNYVGEGNTGTVIYNNFFEGYVSIDFPVDTKFVHNTLVEQDRYSVFSFYYPTGENNIVANNIFLGTDVETLIFLYLERDIEVGLIWDYNLYYVRMDDGTSEPWLITRAVDASDPEMPDPDASDSFSNLSEWQAFQTDFDHNSQSFSPEFVKSNDYHIADPNDYRFGAYFESITNDIDGDLRLEAIGIDVGADQHCGNEQSVVVETCDSYEFDDSILIESGEYSASLLSRHGCDSLVNLSLTIFESFEETMEVEACESYTFNNEPITSSGEYEALFESQYGCDSLVSLSLTILPVFEESVEVSVCDTYEFNNQLLTESGEYSASLLSQNGCDSLVNLDLNILEKDQVDIVESACHSYIFDGTEIFESGQYSATFSNQSSCDSLVNLSLTIFEEPSSDITMNGIVLFAEAKEGATYQWIDCSTNEPIEGETKRQLTPPRSGSYSVRISNENCTVVSECVESVVLSVKDEIAKSVKVYPNPTTGLLHLDLNARYGEVTIEVFNVSGQLKKSRKYLATKKIELDMSDQVSGIYFVHLRTLGSIDQIIKIIKK